MGCTASRHKCKLELHSPTQRRRLPPRDRNLFDGDSQTDSQFATASSYVDITTQEVTTNMHVAEGGKTRKGKIGMADSKKNNV